MAAVRWPVFLLLMGTVIVLAFGVGLSAHQANSLALERQRRIIRYALDREIGNVAKTLAISAHWDDPIVHLRNPSPADLTWADDFVGVWLHDRFGHDEVYILNAADRTIYAMRGGRRAPAEPIEAAGPEVAEMIDEVRGRTRLSRSAKRVQPPPSGIALPDYSADFVRVRGRPAVVAVMKSKPITTAVRQKPGEELLFVSVVFMDGGVLRQLADRQVLDVTRFSTAPAREAGEETVAVLDRYGAPVGYMFWRPLMPGRQVILAMVPLAAMVLAATVGGLMVFIRNLRRIDREMAAGEAALLEALERAEAASQAKGAFLANMSHEIRTPLNGVATAADLLDRTDLDPRQQELVEIVQSSSGTLTRLLSDILDISRIEAGRLELEETAFRLHGALRGVTGLAELQAQEKGLAFQLALDAPDHLLLGDPTRLKQILMNLLSNAVKFTECGEISLKVAVDEDAHPPLLRFSVSDTGIGFTDEQKAHLFERFEQADATITRRFGGSGLGLAISHALVGMMGGRIEAVGRAGAGALFVVELPLRLGQGPREVMETPASAEPAREEPAPGQGRLSVLLADDHPTNRRVVELILAAAGVEITSVENGAEAVAAWGTKPFDLVLMDMQMPVMDGLSATRAIRARERASGRARTPIIIVTANAMAQHAEASLAAGGDVHLPKPLTAQSLFDSINEALSAIPDGEERRQA